MAKKQFQFQVETPASSGEGSNINFEGLTAHVIEAVGCSEKPESMVGVISGVIDLGLQAQEDAKMKWSGTEAEEAEVLEKEREKTGKEPLQYFEDIKDQKTGAMQRFKRWPVKPQRCVAVTVDFPDTLVNRGQFFDEAGVGEDLPYRGLLNNEFFIKGVGKVVGKPYSTREQKNDDGSWSLKNNTILFKMGQATSQLDEKGNFKPNYLGNLIGEAVMVNVHVYANDYDGKQYLNEKLSFGGPVPKVLQKSIPVLDDRFQYMVNFKGPQDEQALKELRQSVINTMTLAEDFIGSDVEKALIAIGKVKEGEAAENQKKAGLKRDDEGGEQRQAPQSAPRHQQAPKEKVEPQPTMDFDAFDDDIPF